MDADHSHEPTNSTTTERPQPLESRWLIGIVAAAVVVRLLLLVFRRSDLHTDPDAYVALANTFRTTGGFHAPGSDVPTAFRPPLYPLLLAAITATGCKMSFAVGLISGCAGAVITFSSWWLSRMAGMRRWWCAAVATMVAFDPLLLRYSTLPMTETLAAALLTVGILLTLQAREQLADKTSNATRELLIAGVVFALAGFCRPVCFLSCGFVSIAMTAGLRGKGLRSALSGLIPVTICVIALVPWTIRNAMVFDAFVPLTTHGGYTLLLGNNEVFYKNVVAATGQPVWSEESFRQWEQKIQNDIERDGIVGEVATDRWMIARARRDIAENWSLFLKACVLRWKRFWGIRPEVEGENRSGLIVAAVSLWYGLMWLGMIVSLLHLKHREPVRILWLAVISFLILHTFYWTNARMRAPLTAIIVVLSMTGWQSIVCRVPFFDRFGKGNLS